MKTLTSISEHSDYLEKKYIFDNEKWHLHRKRVLFGKRQPQLSDFVPCGEDGLPIEKPSEHLENRSLYYQELEAYQQALDKVLFKGWVYYEKDSISSDFYDIKIMNFGDRNIQFYIKDYTKEVKHQEFVRITTLEYLTPYNLELTDNAIKIIGV